MISRYLDPLERYSGAEDLDKFVSGTKTEPGGLDTNHCTLKELKDDILFEGIVPPDAAFLPIHFLEEGAEVQKAVARINIPGNGFGTGFLVSDSLFITNNHVIHDKTEAQKASFEFNYQIDFNSNPLDLIIYKALPDGVFLTNQILDYTLLELETKNSSEITDMKNSTKQFENAHSNTELPKQQRKYLHLNLRKVAEGQRCNIIQHPKGRYKEVVLHENKIDSVYTNVIRYKTDTEPGSSGSPVFDNEWELIAIHHAGGEQKDGNWINNEGIRIDRIIADLQEQCKGIVGGSEILKKLGILEKEPSIPVNEPVFPININKADRRQLLAARYIDEQGADAIIAYRTQRGKPFDSIYDLIALPQFPFWLFSKLSSQITV